MMLSVILTTWRCGPWLDACRTSVREAAAAVRAGEVEILEVCNGNGVAAARNEGLKRAKGEWIVFVDGDDLVDARWFAEIAQRADDADLITFRLASFREGEDFRSRPAVKPFPFAWTACAYRRSIIPAEGFRDLVCGEDALFLLHCRCRAQRPLDVSLIVYGYRHREGSATSSRPTLRRFRDRVEYGVSWLEQAAAVRGADGDWAAARLRVARDVMGSLAIEVRQLEPQPWDLWYAALDRLLATKALPLRCALVAWLCRMLRWRALVRLIRK